VGVELASASPHASSAVHASALEWETHKQASGQWSLPRVLRRDAILRRYLAVADMIACAAALLVATDTVRHQQIHWVLVFALPAVVPLAKIIGLYDRDELLLRKSTLDETPGVLRLATTYTLLLWLLAPELVIGQFYRDQIILLWVSLGMLLLVARLATRALFNHDHRPERCLVVGEQSVCEQVERKLDSSKAINACVALSLTFDSPEEEAEEMGALAQSWGLQELAMHYDAHRLIIAPHQSDAEHIRDLVQTATGLGLHVSIVPRVLEVIGSSVAFDDLDGLTVMGVQRFGLPRSSRLMKRTMDFIGAMIGVLLISPLLAAIAIAIKIDSRGPVFFRQRRVGQDGKAFGMFKFRTMVHNAEQMKAELHALNEAEGLFKIVDDPRITRVGRILRKLSIDELPQLFNVLRGEMSLVGPRPLIVNEDACIEGWYRERLALTPGMTGRWQILGSARIPLSEMVKLDYLYVVTWSLWNDVKILLRTVPFVLGRRGM
jgi:exopolysaccharide biosynthesis polyprenyl glycosylphosphotransferase